MLDLFSWVHDIHFQLLQMYHALQKLHSYSVIGHAESRSMQACAHKHPGGNGGGYTLLSCAEQSQIHLLVPISIARITIVQLGEITRTALIAS